MKDTSDFGFIRVAAAIPEVKVADCVFNAQRICRLIRKAVKASVQIVCFPELSISAYTCGDLFHQTQLLQQAEAALSDIIHTTIGIEIVAIVGLPVQSRNRLFNAAAVIQAGKVLGVVPKTHIPNNNEFYERRWFFSGDEASADELNLCGQRVPFGKNLLFENKKCSFAVEVCEDLWSAIPPSSYHAIQGATLVFNLSASNELTGKNEYRKSLIRQQSARCHAGYVYASAGWGESTTDTVFGGNGFIYENGTLLAESKRFCFEEQLIVSEIDGERLLSERIRKSSSWETGKQTYRSIPFSIAANNSPLTRAIDPHPFVPKKDVYDERCEEIFSIQMGGLAKRILHTKARSCVIGISGGLDSTLALLACVKTYDKLRIARENIVGVTMPGYGTTGRTYHNALQLMKALGVSSREIDIKAACEQHFKDIGHDRSVHDVTYENTQARERTQILMDIANQTGGLVIGTGDLSELALGWATYNGDHMSMYGINSGIPKTLVRHLVSWAAETQVDSQSSAILADIIDTPVSPELLPAAANGDISQKTEDLVGPYELHDFFLYYTVRFGFSPRKIVYLGRYAFEGKYDEEVIEKWLKVFLSRFFSQQFKRSCLPDGPKIGSINLSPRGDWRMPSDASFDSWWV